MLQERAIHCPGGIISEFEVDPRYAEFGAIEQAFALLDQPGEYWR
jgi:hypothetical protein